MILMNNKELFRCIFYRFQVIFKTKPNAVIFYKLAGFMYIDGNQVSPLWSLKMSYPCRK